MEKPKFQLYNTMTKQKEDFKPKEEGKVGMYVCGVTAYDFSHIGHARAYVAFDVLYRYLKYLDYEVNYVRNFTDVDDKIIRRANELGEDPIQLSGRFCQEFLYDMTDLQCLPPTHQPRVSDHMDEIREMIITIIQNECAYSVDGDVYFSVDKFPAYGRLSGRKLEDNRAGERIAVDTRKRNPADFALWKAAKPGEPSWESPWGPGRPGWHIECSAMSARYLTPSFDIHGGGMDLIFPHHENELAQSCAACSDSNIKYWLHNGFVTENNEKMSKSLGNFFTIRDITKQYHPLALRYFLMSTHYRSPVNYSTSQLEIASDSVFYIYQTLCDVEDALSQFREKVKEGKNSKADRITSEAQDCINKLRSDFQSKMADDLHTQDILNASLLETLRLMNKSLEALKKKKQQQQQQQQPLFHSLIALEKEVKNVMETLGLLSSSTYSEVLRQLKEKALGRAGLTEEDVSSFIEERVQARKNKEYAKSDQIRLDLKAKGIALMDLGNETIWRPCVPAEPEQHVQRQQPVAPVSTHVQQDQPGKPASTPVQQNQPAAPVSTLLQEEQPVAPVSTPVREEQPVAPVSTPVVEKQPVAPVSTPVREEQPVAPVSTPVVEKQPVAPVSTPVREEQPDAPVSTPVVEKQPVAPVSTPFQEEQPIAPVSTPVLEEQPVAPISRLVQEEQPVAPIST